MLVSASDFACINARIAQENGVHRRFSRSKIASWPGAQHVLSDHHQMRPQMATKLCKKPNYNPSHIMSARLAAASATRRCPGRETAASQPSAGPTRRVSRRPNRRAINCGTAYHPSGTGMSECTRGPKSLRRPAGLHGRLACKPDSAQNRGARRGNIGRQRALGAAHGPGTRRPALKAPTRAACRIPAPADDPVTLYGAIWPRGVGTIPAAFGPKSWFLGPFGKSRFTADSTPPRGFNISNIYISDYLHNRTTICL